MTADRFKDVACGLTERRPRLKLAKLLVQCCVLIGKQ